MTRNNNKDRRIRSYTGLQSIAFVLRKTLIEKTKQDNIKIWVFFRKPR